MTQSPAATRPRFFSSSMAALLKSAGRIRPARRAPCRRRETAPRAAAWGHAGCSSRSARRTDARHDQRRVPAFGQRDDGLHARKWLAAYMAASAMVSSQRVNVSPRRWCECVVVGASPPPDRPVPSPPPPRSDTGPGAFGRQHDGVRVVEHRVGHVRHLGARGHGAGHHGLHHLGGRDDHLCSAYARAG